VHERDEGEGFDNDDEGYDEACLEGRRGECLVWDPGEEPEGTEEDEAVEYGET